MDENSELERLKAENQRLETTAQTYKQLHSACMKASQNRATPHPSSDLQARLWTLQYIMRVRSSAAAKLLETGTADADTQCFITGVLFAWTEIETLLEKAIQTDEDLMQYAAFTPPLV